MQLAFKTNNELMYKHYYISSEKKLERENIKINRENIIHIETFGNKI